MPFSREPWIPKLALAVLVLFALSSTALALGYKAQAARVQQNLYQRCLQRQGYDAKADAFRQAMMQAAHGFAAQEEANRFIDEPLRQARVAQWDAIADAAQQANAAKVVGSCEQLR